MDNEYKKIIIEKKNEAKSLMTKKQIVSCNVAIHIASIGAGAAGAIPIPLADALPISGIQITMAFQLGRIFDRKLTESTAKALVSAAASTFFGRELVKAIPGVGWGISAIVAAGVTEAIGWSLAVDFAKAYQTESANPDSLYDLAEELNNPEPDDGNKKDDFEDNNPKNDDESLGVDFKKMFEEDD